MVEKIIYRKKKYNIRYGRLIIKEPYYHPSAGWALSLKIVYYGI